MPSLWVCSKRLQNFCDFCASGNCEFSKVFETYAKNSSQFLMYQYGTLKWTNMFWASSIMDRSEKGMLSEMMQSSRETSILASCVGLFIYLFIYFFFYLFIYIYIYIYICFWLFNRSAHTARPGTSLLEGVCSLTLCFMMFVSCLKLNKS